MPSRLIITNGDESIARLREAGIEAEMVAWRDPLHDGPVPQGLVFEALSIVRAHFLASYFGRDLPDILAEFQVRDATMRNHGQYERVELWFEHDLYDQLQLVQVLDFFTAERRTEGLFLVQAEDYLGQQAPDALRVLEAKAAVVTSRHAETARRAWKAFTAHTPENLVALSIEPLSALPHLGPALRRLVLELPLVKSGVGLTEERILAILSNGRRPVADVFNQVEAQEGARFLADLGFFRKLDGLAFVGTPLITGLPFPTTRFAGSHEGPQNAEYKRYVGSTVMLTQSGRAAVFGRFDHAVENGIDRWLGGTHLTRNAIWRRDKDGSLVSPPRKSAARPSLPPEAPPAVQTSS